MHIERTRQHMFQGLHLFITFSGWEEIAMWVVWLLCLQSSFHFLNILLWSFMNSFAKAFDAGHCQRQDIRPEDAHGPAWKLLPFSDLERSLF